MKDRAPTDFETKCLFMIAKYSKVPTGNKSVHYTAAARRLEKLGYSEKVYWWYLTEKGRAYLKKIAPDNKMPPDTVRTEL